MLTDFAVPDTRRNRQLWDRGFSMGATLSWTQNHSSGFSIQPKCLCSDQRLGLRHCHSHRMTGRRLDRLLRLVVFVLYHEDVYNLFELILILPEFVYSLCRLRWPVLRTLIRTSCDSVSRSMHPADSAKDSEGKQHKDPAQICDPVQHVLSPLVHFEGQLQLLDDKITQGRGLNHFDSASP